MLLFSGDTVRGRSEPDRLSLVKDGESAATIVIPGKPTQWTTTATEWLVKDLNKASEARLSVIRVGDEHPSGTSISLRPNVPAVAAKNAEERGVTVSGLHAPRCQ